MRLLRSRRDGNDYSTGEERMFSLSGLEGLLSSGLSKAEKEGLKAYLKDNKPPSCAFSLLKLDENVDTVLTNLKLKAFTEYLEEYNKQSESFKGSMILTLMRVFGEDTVATTLEAAKKVPRTEAIATKLQKDRLNAWLKIEKSVDDVFMHLRLSTAADLTDPRFSVLSKYADFVKAKTGKSNDSVKTSILLQMVAAWNNPSKTSAEREALKKQYLSWRSDYHWDFLEINQHTTSSTE